MIDWKLAPEGADRVVVRFYNGDEMSCKKVINRPIQPKTVADAVEWFMNGGWGSEWPYYDMDCITYGDSYFAFANSESISPNRYLVCTRFQFEGFGDTEGKQIKEDNMVGRSNITMEDINKHLDTGENPKGHVNANDVEKILKSSYEQESEKWTHTYGSTSIKCRILATDGDECWVLNDCGNKVTEYLSSLRPIKPTISESDAKALELFANKSHMHGVAWAVKEYLDGHDII